MACVFCAMKVDCKYPCFFFYVMIPEMETSFRSVNLGYVMTFSGGSKLEALCGSPSLPTVAKHGGRLNQVNAVCSFSWVFFSLNILCMQSN